MNKAELWENGCKSDRNRNDFVVPKLSAWLHKNPAQHIVYLGSGTGYIVRELVPRYPTIHFTLVDKSEERIELSKSLMPTEANTTHICADILELPPDTGTFDVIILCNLLLEVEGDRVLISVIKSLLREQGYLCVFVPDTLVDFLNSSPNEDDIESFVTSAIRLRKWDKFTGDEYPFLAQRLINLISRFCEQNFNLVRVERSDNIDGYYFLVLQHAAHSK